LSRGVVIFAHGSRVESANEAVRAVARELVRASSCSNIIAAFLELGSPSLPDAASGLIAAGVDQVVVVPYFLTAGLHMERDLPILIEQIRQAHPNVQLTVAPPLDGHPALVQILADRAGLSETHSTNT
jgi:sirohydrochlorin cobaltochelatase